MTGGRVGRPAFSASHIGGEESALPSSATIVLGIVFVLWHGYIGGAERMTVRLAQYLRKLGHDVSIVLIDGPGLLEEHMNRVGVEFECLSLHSGRAVFANPKRIGDAVNRARADVVFTPRLGYLAAALRIGGFSGPVVAIEHGDLLATEAAGIPNRFRTWAERLSCLRLHAAEVPVSAYMTRHVECWPHPRLASIPLGVEVQGEAPQRETTPVFTVGYAGRHHPGKGVDQLIRAIASINCNEASPAVRALIAGDGELRAEWESLAANLGVTDSVEFTGWTEDLSEHWSRCDVAIAPNDYFQESFCLSIAEAMAAGCPAIVTDTGALPELVTQDTGRIVVPGDPEALAQAILAYARNDKETQAHGQAAWLRARREYSVQRVARQYEALAQGLL